MTLTQSRPKVMFESVQVNAVFQCHSGVCSMTNLLNHSGFTLNLKSNFILDLYQRHLDKHIQTLPQ